MTDLDHLLDDVDLSGLDARPLEDLREVRDRLNRIELGLSYGRRMAQGRLDIITCELERRSGNDTASPDDLLGRLPDVLARHNRPEGLPRPIRDESLPPFADDIVAELDRLVAPSELVGVADLDDVRLGEITARLADVEVGVSDKRHEVHRLIDEVQQEIVGRYRSGAASVDDLLR